MIRCQFGTAKSFAVPVASLAIAFLSLTSPVRAATDLRAEWKDGLHVVAEDKSVDISIGGFFQNDWTFQRADDDLDALFPDAFVDGTEFRRARIVTKGVFQENFEFMASYEFSKGESGLKDMYMGLRGLPGLGGVRVGHFKEPFGFDQLVSDTYSTFLERGLSNAFAPSRNTGIMVLDGRDRMTWAGGIFRDADSFANGSGGGKYNATARITGIPWDGGGNRLFHVGVSGSVRNPAAGEVEFAARPETNLAPKLVSTSAIESTDALLFGGEAALLAGPFSITGEVARASVESADQIDPVFWAAHVDGAFFLTGESRSYNRKTGVYDRTRPKRNFNGKGSGPGAWEVALRWSRLDLEDGELHGGLLDDVTCGLNWHLNPNVRVMSNYVHGDSDEAGACNTFSMRFQTDF